jgi:hypothetical protein
MPLEWEDCADVVDDCAEDDLPEIQTEDDEADALHSVFR